MTANTLEKLNEEQHLAVTSTDQNLLILAGAGSGKTTVLTMAISWQIQNHNINPGNILAVTFTNKSANEMLQRIKNSLNNPNPNIWIGTFHGICHKLLRINHAAANLDSEFQIIDTEDQKRIIKRIHKTMQLDEGRWPPKKTIFFINNLKEEGIRAKNAHTETDHKNEVLLQVYQTYENYCREHNIIDFTELLLRCYEMLANNPEVLAHYHNRFSHIYIDEFQDTNNLQYKWLKLLSTATTKVIAVGDDDQSIYSWRGAQVENMQSFQDDFSDVKLIRLERNYRSTQNILNAANHLIKNNDGRLGKKLWTESEDGDPISLFEAYNDLDEASFIVHEIKRHCSSGTTEYKDVAILYRSNAQSRVLEDALNRSGTPYRIYGGLRFFDRMEIKDMLAYLRLVYHQDSDSSFERIINTPPRGIGAMTLNLIREQATSQQISLWATTQQLMQADHIPSRIKTSLTSFVTTMNELIEFSTKNDLSTLTDKIATCSGYQQYLEKDRTETGRARLENIAELVSATKQYQIAESSYHEQLGEFLNSIALDSDQGMQDKATQNSVQLMTLHAGKGLEFPIVFMSGVEEGLFPHQMSVQEPGRLEEERRLCYVGITRAMLKLYISYAQTRRLHGKETIQRPSRFIGELPPESVHEVRTTTPRATIKSPSKRSSLNYQTTTKTSSKPKPQDNGGEYRSGRKVLHRQFGMGTIIDGSSADDGRIQINFKKVGKKWLMLQYAKLEFSD